MIVIRLLVPAVLFIVTLLLTGLFMRPSGAAGSRTPRAEMTHCASNVKAWQAAQKTAVAYATKVAPTRTPTPAPQ